MISGAVRAPVALLLDPRLLPSDKLVWLALCAQADQGRANITLLQSASGLSRPTVRKALARLTAAGWVAGTPGFRQQGGRFRRTRRLPDNLCSTHKV